MTATDMKDMNKLIMELRATTGAGITACKSALTQAGGDYQAALTELRKKGLADAAKKSARITKEGVVAYAVDGRFGAIVELNCETDFVARVPEFQTLAQTLAGKFAKGEFKTAEDAAPLVQPVFQKLGENMALRRFERFELKGEGVIAGYIHLGAKKGALVQLETAAKSPELAEFAKELLLQIVGSAPKYLRREEVPAAEIEKEKEIYTEILKKEGKPDAQIPKIVEGKINKLFYQSLCLLEQPSVRDGKVMVSALIKDMSAKLGAPVQVTRFSRYQLGE